MQKEKNKLLIKILVEVSRVLLGSTFLFSGFVKSIDPIGTVYQIEEYLTVFELPGLHSLALPIAFFLCALEFLMGVCLLLGLYRKWNSRILFFVMVFMTGLTFYIAIANPVKDCGCFGDAVKLTNWQTFLKNIILLPCSVLVFKFHQTINNLFTGRSYWMAFLYIVTFISVFLYYNYRYDPILDFRPYKIGNNIPELMKVPKGQEPVIETSLVYMKDGLEKEFSQDNFPWADSTWTFVRMETNTIKEGKEPAVNDFIVNKLFFNEDNTKLIRQDDITEQILTDSNYVFLMISPSLSEMRMNNVSNFEDVMNYAHDYHYSFYFLTASTADDIIAWEKENAVSMNFCRMDERVLKTIVRTNPGLILLRKGTVINKWADVSVPAEEDLSKPLDELSYGQELNSVQQDRLNILWVTAIFILPLLLIKGLDFGLFSKRQPDIHDNNIF